VSAPERGLRRLTQQRLDHYGLRPRKSLGQNFLVDDNTLDMIVRLAAVEPDEVVLEIGGGLGVLSERLAAEAAHLHVIEFDPELAGVLRDVLAQRPATVLEGDAVRVDLTALAPPPTKVVANLPYSVAATVVLRTIAELPTVTNWVVMVQREVGERFAAGPGSKIYGVPSALAQLSCKVAPLKPIKRTVFMPAPHVDSMLLGLTRIAPPAPAGTQKLIVAGFTHRRKALPRSLEMAWGVPGMRMAARAALVELGFPEDVRAERLSADDFRRLHERLIAAGVVPGAPLEGAAR
jgi:16S rRNA (adenine1518-N6/adenine1519-N6)-dimethyltransferase